MKNETKLSSSLEDYLETILLLEQKNRVARVKDIAKKMNVTMPSVTGAMRNLREHGLIDYEKNSYINLTAEGKKIAECILNRHHVLMRFFKDCLKLEGDWVENQACRLEHAINHETTVRISKLTEWIDKTVFKEKKMTESEWLEMLRQ
ncbi:MAG: metal-dependent transcriptional regulator [Spirochaetales bacterium]|uniref:Transcriptional regulator MntR n=1 Tax=Candidatus Thalassospirochaeta sargassi TaxID=3119039 RepID=A0AAJ1IHM6_9SPIO|nr:metal-dependent transcriptional regulator [Spirochaetales bacterium]